MPAPLEEMLGALRASRRYFLRHLDGLTDEQWAWKPYPECKSALEIVAHLRVDDLAAVDSLETGQEPRYHLFSEPAYAEMDRGPAHLLRLLASSHESLLDELQRRFADTPLDAPICVWGATMPLLTGIPYFSSEDFYHAGQIAFIRMATDPGWDYYRAIYGQMG